MRPEDTFADPTAGLVSLPLSVETSLEMCWYESLAENVRIVITARGNIAVALISDCYDPVWVVIIGEEKKDKDVYTLHHIKIILHVLLQSLINKFIIYFIHFIYLLQFISYLSHVMSYINPPAGPHLDFLILY